MIKKTPPHLVAVEPAGTFERIATRRASLGVAACVGEKRNPGEVGTSISAGVVAHEVLPTLVAAPDVEKDGVGFGLALRPAAAFHQASIPALAGAWLKALAADGIRVALLIRSVDHGALRVAPGLQ